MVIVKSSCIGCGLCASIAWNIFRVEGAPAVVVKQPETPEEIASYEQAKAMCPAQAIE